jgi:hypothetical protein
MTNADLELHTKEIFKDRVNPEADLYALGKA